MPTLTKNKKIAIGLISVFLVLGFVFILTAPNARAAFSLFGLENIAGNAIMNGLAWLAYSVLSLFSKLVAVAAVLLEAAFKIETLGFTKATIVTTGWEITRGLCNMIFALLLLLMAFDTILQTDKFPVKSILPKLIIVALTINFSLMILGIIIDFSQVLTRYFIDAAGGSSHSISEQLANSLNIQQIFKVNTSLTSTDQIQQSLGGGPASMMKIIGSLIFGAMIILIAAFSLAAGAIFMLLRLVSLWVLLIFAPLAWMGMIAPLPGLKGYIDDWWNKFFKWTFFAPIYAFFIYLAVSTANISSLFKVNEIKNQTNAIGEMFVNDFLSDIGRLMQFVVVIALLILGLKTAQESGLAGAGAVVGWGKKAGDKLKGYAKNAAKRPGELAYDTFANKAVQLAGGAVGGLGFKRLGRRLTAKGVGMETEAEGRDRHKAYATNLKTMSDMDLQEEVKKAYGIRKLLAARHAKERGLLDKTEDTQTVKKAMETFGAYGVKDPETKTTKEQRDLEDMRWDAVDDDSYRNKVVRRAKENGNLDKAKPSVLKDPKAMDSFMEELSEPEIEEQVKKWGKATKKTFEESLAKTFKDTVGSWTDTNEIKKRGTYAKVTGKIESAFADSQGRINPANEGQMKMLAGHIGKMTATSIAKIMHPEKAKDIGLVARNAKAELVISFGKEKTANTEQKGIFYQEALGEALKKNDKEILRALKSPGWSAFNGIDFVKAEKEKKTSQKNTDA